LMRMLLLTTLVALVAASGQDDASEMPKVTITYCSPCGFYQHVVKLSMIITSRYPDLEVKLVPNERMNYAFEVKIDDDVVYNKVFGDGYVNSEQVERLLYLLRLKIKSHWPMEGTPPDVKYGSSDTKED